MEIAGITLRVLEIITVTLCGIRLAVPPGHFRWERLWTKVLYWILVIFWIVFAAGNIYFYKFSSITGDAYNGYWNIHFIDVFFMIHISGSYLCSFLFIGTQSMSLGIPVCFYIMLCGAYSFKELCDGCRWPWMALDTVSVEWQ